FIASSAPREFSRELVCVVVALCGGDFLFFLSFGLPMARAWEIDDCAAEHVHCDGAVCAHDIRAGKCDVVGGFVSGRHGRDCTRLLDVDSASEAAIRT